MHSKFHTVLLRFFRINDPYRLLGLLIVVSIVGLFHFLNPVGILQSELKHAVLGEALAGGNSMYSQLMDHTPPLAAWIYGLKDVLMGRSYVGGQIMALLIILFQASYFAILLINNKAYAENTYLPALIFALLNFISFDILSFSPELMACTLLLFALNQLFHEIEFKIQRDDIVVKLGFYLGLATFLVITYGLFLLVCVFILIVFARAGFRKIALLLLGFILPHALLGSAYYYTDQFGLLWKNYYVENFSFSENSLMSFQGLIVLASVPLIYFVLSFFMMNREARFTKYQSQLMQVMFLWMITALLQVFVDREISATSFLPFVPPFAYSISHYLLLIRRKWRAELMLWVFLAGIISINFLSRYGRIKAVDYTDLFVAAPVSSVVNKKVMNLGSGFEIYQNNSLGGFFFNWELSKGYFRDLSVYDHVEIIASSFQSDPPDVIIDPDNLFAEVLQRIPGLKLSYKRSGNVYYRVSN